MKSWDSRWRPAGRWFDPILAVAMLVACEAEVVINVVGDHGQHHWPLVPNILVVALLTVPLAWRRTAPLASAIAVKTGVLLLVISLSDVQSVNFPQLVLFITPYSVAAYSHRARALVGLAYAGVIICAVNLTTTSNPASWVFSVGVCLASWGTGRIIRSRRALSVELKRVSEQIVAEREGRELLAIAEQRTRIARELHAIVATSVSSMIVQTQAAQRLLPDDPELADEAMATIEETGRQALTEMRRILGVLRHHDDGPELAPQPGIGQIATLVEQARHAPRTLHLQVEGEPGPLPASVDVGVYRILEDAITSVENPQPIDIVLRFRDDDIELALTSHGAARLDWPTITMRERVALCQGDLDVDVVPGTGDRLVVRLPRIFEGTQA